MFKDNLIHTRKLMGMTQEDIAEKLGVPKGSITDDMFFALRKPKDVMDASKEEMQETYDKDIATIDRIINDLT